MARAAAKLRAIAFTTLQDTVRRRVPYVMLLLIVLIAATLASRIVFLRMAGEAGEAGIAATIRAGFVSNTLDVWAGAGMVLAVFLAAGGLSSEIGAKTIINVLSRPVDRALYLTGRFLGTLIFLWVFQLIGILVALGVAHAFDVAFVPTLWVGFAEMFVTAFMFSAVSLGLSVVLPPVLAGGVALLLSFLPELVGSASHDPRQIVRALVTALYYLAPAQMPVDLIGESFTKELLNPDYSLYFRVLAENLLYGMAALVLASVVFARREIRVR